MWLPISIAITFGLALWSCSGATDRSEGVMAAGCTCNSGAMGATELSLDCFCAEFPSSCASYEEAKASVTTGAQESDLCAEGAPWTMMEHTGCGKVTIFSNGGYGGGDRVYDAETHELVAASLYSDIGFGSCDTFGYRAGSPEPCSEGTVCSLCDSTGQSCAPACSITLLERMGRLPTYGADEGMLYPDCPDDSSQPLLRLGCGRVSVVSPFGSVETFTAGDHVALRVQNSADECPLGWGAPLETCAEEVTCSLCANSPERCTAEQLDAR